MTFFTRKGDKGKTGLFGCDQRISKSSAVAEALGSLDEVNSFLGLCKIQSKASNFYINTEHPSFEYVVHELQEMLFIVQAELAGADKKVSAEKVAWVEEIVRAIEEELPPITTFFISGGAELAATFDVARTIARRAERRVVEVDEEGEKRLGEHTLAFMNRLSSILYALARLSNHKSGIKEDAPDYQ